MASLYTPPEGIAARDRANGQKLTLAGAILAIFGAIGLVLSAVLKVIWLGVFGGPIGFLSGIAVVLGVVLFITGFNLIKNARRGSF